MNWNKYFEPFMWVICAIAIIALILTDPIAVAFLLEWWHVITAVTLGLAVCGAISFCTGFVLGEKKGRSIGFENGYDQGRGFY